MSKISGPLLDRIDLHLDVPALPPKDLLANASAEPSHAIKERILKAQALQQERFAGTGIAVNSYMNHRQIKTFCGLNEERSY